MIFDRTERTRKLLIGVINSNLSEEDNERLNQLISDYGQDNVWDTQGVQRDFTINSFFAPFVTATRKADNVKGSLTFCHSPRFYFNFVED